MKPSQIVLLILVTAVWGLNFVVIKIGVGELPPLFLNALRFGFAAFPAILFVKRPEVPWRLLAIFGLLFGVIKFSLLFVALKVGISAGLAPLILQNQALFTVVLSALVLRETARTHQLVGLLLSVAGMGIIGVSLAMRPSTSVTLVGFTLTFLAAAAWSVANLVARRAGKVNMFSFTIWSSIFVPIPVLLLSYFIEGPATIMHGLATASFKSVWSLGYIVLVSTLFGFGVWNSLINRFGPLEVAPFGLLVPIFAMTFSSIFLNEHVNGLQLLATVCVLAGLTVNIMGERWHLAALFHRSDFEFDDSVWARAVALSAGSFAINPRDER